jgi:hypothetical protein
MSEEELTVIDTFDFCFFLDEYILFVYPFAKEAARRAVLMAVKSELSFLPRIGSLSYVEMDLTEEKLPHALIALLMGKESFSFCDLITTEAGRLNQLKALVSCPHYLEIKVQEVTQNAVVLEEESQNIKVTRVYWLSKEQLLMKLWERQKACSRIKRLFFTQISDFGGGVYNHIIKHHKAGVA